VLEDRTLLAIYLAGHYAQPRPAGDLAGHDRHGNLLTITGTNGGTASRVFAVTPASPPAAVAIDNLTITGGNAAAVASATPGTQGGNVFIQNTSTGCWRTGG
jgi:hypothetical protein